MTDSVAGDTVTAVIILIIGIVIGLIIGVPAGSFSEGLKYHPEQNPSNVSGILVNQFQQGSYWYLDLLDDGEIKTVYTSDPVLVHHLVNGTFYKFSLANTIGIVPGTVGRIDKQVFV